MFTALLEIVNVLNSLSPLAIIGLLSYNLYLVLKGKTPTDEKVESIASNHLHDLPEAIEILRRIEMKLGEEFSYIRARLNGKA